MSRDLMNVDAELSAVRHRLLLARDLGDLADERKVAVLLARQEELAAEWREAFERDGLPEDAG